MENSDSLWMIGVLLLTFFIFFIVAMILRNHAAKRDNVGKSEGDSISCSVSKTNKKLTKN